MAPSCYPGECRKLTGMNLKARHLPLPTYTFDFYSLDMIQTILR